MDNSVVLEYQKYIYGIAKKFEGYKSKEDLYQAGFMGLVMALRNYKKELDSKFSTYAYKYIYGEMCKLAREDKLIRLSRNVIKLKTSIENAKSFLQQKLNREPTMLELSNFLEMSISDIEEVLKINTTYQSIDGPIKDDSKELNLYDVIPCKSLDMETLVALKEALSKIDDTSRDILNYSMNMTESEIAKMYNTNQVNISRTLKKIKQNIRTNMQ
ncbi:MAG: sigma-70 family RNA polymerase sigma factor [Bacilli bacterium]|nr:sigma-70 family RNA polymerase sigma factor [Bacilli bacterium]